MNTHIEKTASTAEIMDKVQCTEIKDKKEFNFQGDTLVQFKDYGGRHGTGNPFSSVKPLF